MGNTAPYHRHDGTAAAAPGLPSPIDEERLEQDRAAVRQTLRGVHLALGGALWARRDGWLSPATTPLDAWSGVTAAAAGEQLVGLDLSFQGAAGSLGRTAQRLADDGASTRALSRLRRLALTRNRLTGRVPRALSMLGALEELQLGANRLTGPLPSAHLPAGLTCLVALRNALSGPLPSLAQLPRLRKLSLAHNGFDGALEHLVGAVRPQDGHPISGICVAHNALDGPVPAALSVDTFKELLCVVEECAAVCRGCAARVCC